MQKISRHLFKFQTGVLVFLLLIALILFFGLFKKEISTWKSKNWPQYKAKPVTISETCSRIVTKNIPLAELNSSREERNNKIEEARTQCREKFGPTPKLGGENNKVGQFMDYFVKEDNCIKEIVGEIVYAPVNTTYPATESYPCSKTVYNEVWLYAIGKYWIKIHDITPTPTRSRLF